jgi:hypothetical protein
MITFAGLIEFRIKILSLLLIVGMTSIIHGRASFHPGIFTQEIKVNKKQIYPSLELDSSRLFLSLNKGGEIYHGNP